MGEIGSGNNEVESKEINESNNQQEEVNNIAHQESGKQLEAKSQIEDNSDLKEKKQLEGTENNLRSNEIDELKNSLDDNAQLDDNEKLEIEQNEESEKMGFLESDEWKQLEENTPDSEIVEQKAQGKLQYNGTPEDNEKWTQEEKKAYYQQIYDNDFGAVNEDVLDYENSEYLQSGKNIVDWGEDSVDEPETVTIPEGTVLVQYSHEGKSGTYFASEGSDYDDLQLPDSEDKRVMKKYMVQEGGLEVEKSEIAIQIWNKNSDLREGTGEYQFVTQETAEDLVKQGKLLDMDESNAYNQDLKDDSDIDE